MLASNIDLKPGTAINSPAGRRLEVGDIFVPRNDQLKSRSLPGAFRNLGRKVVVFHDGSIAALADVKRCFSAPPSRPRQGERLYLTTPRTFAYPLPSNCLLCCLFTVTKGL